MEEVWLPVVGQEGFYEVSNYCRIRSVDRTREVVKSGKLHLVKYKGKIIKLHKDKGGYLICRLYGKTTKTVKAHRVGMQAFVQNHKNLPCVNHKYEDKTNNFIFVNPDGSVNLEKSSLEWCSHEYNNNYGTAKQRRSEKQRKNEIIQTTKKGVFVKSWKSLGQIQKTLNIPKTNVSLCCLGKRKSAGGFVWKYV